MYRVFYAIAGVFFLLTYLLLWLIVYFAFGTLQFYILFLPSHFMAFLCIGNHFKEIEENKIKSSIKQVKEK